MATLLAKTDEHTNCQGVNLKCPSRAHVLNACPIAGGTLSAEFSLLPAFFTLPQLPWSNPSQVTQAGPQESTVPPRHRQPSVRPISVKGKGYCKSFICFKSIVCPFCSHALRPLSTCSTHLTCSFCEKVRSLLLRCIV